jgi:hypothetical protein
MRQRRSTKPKKWSRVHGTVYALNTKDTEGNRTLLLRRVKLPVGYVGMYSGDWTERIRQHMYGGGPYRCTPKDWADLVPGYNPHAKTLATQRRSVRQAIVDGGAQRLWHGDCFYWYVKLRESIAIARHRPLYNIQENLNNSKHVPKWVAQSQRQQRDLKLAAERDSVVLGCRLNPDGTWSAYGSRAEEVGSRWKSSGQRILSRQG